MWMKLERSSQLAVSRRRNHRSGYGASDLAAKTRESTQVFLQDVRTSLAVWRTFPPLPIVTAVLSGIYVTTLPLPGLWVLFGFAAFFVSIGWIGTQFMCYQRAFGGWRIHSRELAPLTWTLIARYIWLYFLGFVPLLG
ncbi:MAG TPA: hypothetical protein VIN12_07725, partial [Candidatus Dormibacteraeota bacterium]